MKTIFDIGFHVGQDSDFYLKCGYTVIALEANPILVAEGSIKFRDFILSGQLTIINNGVTNHEDIIKFYVNTVKSEYSSFNYEIASRECENCVELNIQTTTLRKIINQFGIPYYIKIDIEGYDHIAISTLENTILPKFISIENGFERDLNTLHKLGYSQFNFVDQSKVSSFILEETKESASVGWEFIHGSSGPFGDDIKNSQWLNYSEALKVIQAHWNRPFVDPVNDGWYDLHARLE
jgi:FkbM family methyltransferase